jgi:hypothetical protein
MSRSASLPSLAHVVLSSHGEDLRSDFPDQLWRGVNRLGTEEPSDRITDLTACYMALVEHGEGCDNCNVV